jgi:hypothetical protein
MAISNTNSLLTEQVSSSTSSDAIVKRRRLETDQIMVPSFMERATSYFSWAGSMIRSASSFIVSSLPLFKALLQPNQDSNHYHESYHAHGGNDMTGFLSHANQISDLEQRSEALLGFRRHCSCHELFRDIFEGTSPLPSDEQSKSILFDPLITILEDIRISRSHVINPGAHFEQVIFSIIASTPFTSQKKEMLSLIIDSIGKCSALTSEALWFRKAFNNDYLFSFEEFNSLSATVKSSLYFIAIQCQHQEFINQLYAFGIGPALADTCLEQMKCSSIPWYRLLPLIELIQDTPLHDEILSRVALDSQNDLNKSLDLILKIRDVKKQQDTLLSLSTYYKQPIELFYTILTTISSCEKCTTCSKLVLSALEHSPSLSPKQRAELTWLKKASNNSTLLSAYSRKEFNALSKETRKRLHFVANFFNNVIFLQFIHSSKAYKPSSSVLKGAAITTPDHDVIDTQEAIGSFLKDLKREGLILTEEEFKQKPHSEYHYKYDQINRLQGTRLIKKVVREEGLKHIKVPKKYLVVKEKENTFSVSISYKLALLGKENIKIYAKHIKASPRKISLEEAHELLIVLEKTGYKDFAGNNFIVAEDGIYFIDTEFKDFQPYLVSFKTLQRVVQSLLDPKDIKAFSMFCESRQQAYAAQQKVEEEQDKAAKLKDPYECLIPAASATFHYSLDTL